MLDDHAALRGQLAQVSKSGANGAVLFSYGNLFSSERGKRLLRHVSSQLRESCGASKVGALSGRRGRRGFS